MSPGEKEMKYTLAFHAEGKKHTAEVIAKVFDSS